LNNSQWGAEASEPQEVIRGTMLAGVVVDTGEQCRRQA
jgi:hypothetical protein